MTLKPDPAIFAKNWPPFTVDLNDWLSPLLDKPLRLRFYKLGHKCRFAIHEADPQQGWSMWIRANNHRPTWEEVAWARYNFIPDAATMTLLLPNLADFIRETEGQYRNMFLVEQRGWRLDPPPTCPVCEARLVILQGTQTISSARFICLTCETVSVDVDYTVWNEQHGNGLGLKAVRLATPKSFTQAE